jgi:hypothetical protein
MSVVVTNDDWDDAVRAAFAFLHNQQEEGKKLSSSSSTAALTQNCRRQKKFATTNNNNSIGATSLQQLPQIIFDHRDDDKGSFARCKDGSIVLQLLAGRIDKNAAPFQVYGNALCLWCERRAHHGGDELPTITLDGNEQHPTTAVVPATLMLDVRSGNGWTNPKALHIIPFVCSMAQYYYNNAQQQQEQQHHHPARRLQKIIVFPVPHAARYLWEMVKPFLDKTLVQILTIVPGSSERHAPPPNSILRQYVDDMILEKMEQNRVSLFC